MAAPITLVSTTVEQQACEMALKFSQLLNDFKGKAPQADTKSLAASFSADMRKLSATVTLTIPIVKSPTDNGGLSISAEELIYSALPLSIGGQSFTVGGISILI